MNIIESQNPEEINVHSQIWGENELSTVIETTNKGGRRRQEMSIL